MSRDEGEFEPRVGRTSDAGRGSTHKSRSLAAQVRRASAKSGFTRRAPGRRSKGTGTRGRGRSAALAARFRTNARRVVIKARVVRHNGARFRAAPLARHVAYLKRDGVTRDGREASLFDAGSNSADGDAFAGHAEGDRHHFRFIVSPEDATDLADLRTFTRELMADVARDLGTGLEWVAVDHWNTDNPHVHILVRGVADDGTDLVIDKDYISKGMRARAEDRATLELGPRSAREIAAALDKEIDADRWTSLDQRLQQMADEAGGVIDLRPGADSEPGRRRLLGRAAKLDRMGLAENVGPAVWALKPDVEETLRALGNRGDIIKTMHRGMSVTLGANDPARFAVHESATHEPVIGRLVERGLHDELAGQAYAIVDGIDGRVHHLRFDDLDMTADSKPGSIVELRHWTDRRGADRLSLSVRSDLSLSEQVRARGATWLDRQLVAREPASGNAGFGREMRDAMERRADVLIDEGLAHRQGRRLVLSPGLIDTLRARELNETVTAIEATTGLAHRPSAAGDAVSGIYRERITLSSGRFAMIDDGLGFQLVPWRPAIEGQVGKHLYGVMGPGGTIDWTLGRGKGLGV
ncbi:relaxase/mobilization nuclease domain-containing protein [Sphingomonas oryzagri]